MGECSKKDAAKAASFALLARPAGVELGIGNRQFAINLPGSMRAWLLTHTGFRL